LIACGKCLACEDGVECLSPRRALPTTVRFVSQALFEQLPDWDRVALYCGDAFIPRELDDFQMMPERGLMKLLWAVSVNGDWLVDHGSPHWLWEAAVVERSIGKTLELTLHASGVEPGTPAPSRARKAAERVVWVDALPATEFDRIGCGVGFEWAWCELSHSLRVRVRNGVIQTPELERAAAELCARLLLGEEPS
jgi:hypothetical protein